MSAEPTTSARTERTLMSYVDGAILCRVKHSTNLATAFVRPQEMKALSALLCHYYHRSPAEDSCSSTEDSGTSRSSEFTVLPTTGLSVGFVLGLYRSFHYQWWTLRESLGLPSTPTEEEILANSWSDGKIRQFKSYSDMNRCFHQNFVSSGEVGPTDVDAGVLVPPTNESREIEIHTWLVSAVFVGQVDCAFLILEHFFDFVRRIGWQDQDLQSYDQSRYVMATDTDDDEYEECPTLLFYTVLLRNTVRGHCPAQFLHYLLFRTGILQNQRGDSALSALPDSLLLPTSVKRILSSTSRLTSESSADTDTEERTSESEAVMTGPLYELLSSVSSVPNTLFFCAANHAHLEAAKLLLAAGSDPTLHSSTGASIVHYCCDVYPWVEVDGSLEFMKMVIEKGNTSYAAAPSTTTTNRPGSSRSGSTAWDFEERWLGQTPVICACYAGNLIKTRYCLEVLKVNKDVLYENEEGDDEVSDPDGLFNLLHVACISGLDAISVVRYLVEEQGFDPLVKDEIAGITPFLASLLNHETENADHMRRKEEEEEGAEQQVEGEVATTTGGTTNLRVSKYLLSKGAQVDEANHEGWTSLHYAAAAASNTERSTGLVKFLLDNIPRDRRLAFINQRTHTGATAINHSCYWGYVEVTRLLLENGAQVHHRDSKNVAPLFAAANLPPELNDDGEEEPRLRIKMAERKLEIIKLLIEEVGADVNDLVGEQNVPFAVSLLSVHNWLALDYLFNGEKRPVVDMDLKFVDPAGDDGEKTITVREAVLRYIADDAEENADNTPDNETEATDNDRESSISLAGEDGLFTPLWRRLRKELAAKLQAEGT